MKSRLGPASPDHWSEPVREIADSATGKGPPNILYTIAHHPALLPSFLGFTATLATRGVLERRDSELLALRTSLNCRSAFEWGHHVEYGLAAGLEPKELGAIANGPEDPSWSPRDRSLLRACDELHAHQQISDQTYDADRRAHICDRQLHHALDGGERHGCASRGALAGHAREGIP